MACSGPGANQCTHCEKGLVLDPNTLLCGVTGDADCPPRTYLHDNQFTCMGCHRQCYSCQGPGSDECQTCAFPKYLHSECFNKLKKSSNHSTFDGFVDWILAPCEMVIKFNLILFLQEKKERLKDLLHNIFFINFWLDAKQDFLASTSTSNVWNDTEVDLNHVWLNWKTWRFMHGWYITICIAAGGDKTLLDNMIELCRLWTIIVYN